MEQIRLCSRERVATSASSQEVYDICPACRRSPARAVGAVIADPLAQALLVAVGIVLLVIAARERLLIHLDAWILPETADQRQALADAAGALAQAGRITARGDCHSRPFFCARPG